MTTTAQATLGDVVAECFWTYSPDDDDDPDSGPKEANDGYSVWAYFADDADPERVFESRADAIAYLRDTYKGPDCYGVGLEIPSA